MTKGALLARDYDLYLSKFQSGGSLDTMILDYGSPVTCCMFPHMAPRKGCL